MKRSGMKPGRRRTLTAEEREQAMDFKRSTHGEPCAMCGAEAPFNGHGFHDAHHVVEKQELKNRGLPLYDLRNALPLCGEFSTGDCHEAHTNASRRVPFRKLRAENISYAYEVLGDFAGDYLRRKYPMDETEEQT